jgi:hypothetical protein
MIDHIEFESPGGMLGFLLKPSTILRELQETFAYREGRFKELLDRKARSGQ